MTRISRPRLDPNPAPDGQGAGTFEKNRTPPSLKEESSTYENPSPRTS